MAFQMTGFVTIPLEEFWADFATRFIDDSLLGNITKLDITDFDVVFYVGEEEHYGDITEFWEFVHNYFPNEAAETRANKPRIDEDCIHIDIAVGCSSPEGWVEKPEWLK